MKSARHMAVMIMVLVLLEACVLPEDDRDGGYAYKPCWEPLIHDSRFRDGEPSDLLMDVMLGVFSLSCAGGVTIGNGIYVLHRALVHGDTYHSPDGLFSVTLPGQAAVGDGDGLVIRESITPERDYVSFVQRPAQGDIYSITALPTLPERYGDMDVADFSHAVVTDLQVALRAQDQGAPVLERLYEQQITLDGRPSMFATFRREGAGIGPYYLVYFVKKADRAAILSVLWWGDSLPTGRDAEATIRTMDPTLQEFVNSFHLAVSADER